MLVKWNPFNELTRFETCMRSIFDYNNWKPAMDVYEDKEKITLEAELPGVHIKDIKISIDEGNLVIKGEKKFSKEKTGKEYFIIERSEGSFTRSFILPSNIDSNKIKASHNNGILIINIPKKMEKIERNIEINSI